MSALGRDGSPCFHQAAVVKCYHIPSVNRVPVLSPESRQLLATIALGCTSIPAPQLYSSLHEKSLSASTPSDSKETSASSFDGFTWDGSASTEEESSQIINDVKYEDILESIDEVCTDLKVRIKDSMVVAQGTQTFLKRYKEMTTRGKFANAVLGSALYKFGWVFGGKIRSTHGGHLCHGRPIPVSAKAAGRRCGKASRGKAKAPSGRPKGATIEYYPSSKFAMQPRREPKGKRTHSLKSNIIKGLQNGGKW